MNELRRLRGTLVLFLLVLSAPAAAGKLDAVTFHERGRLGRPPGGRLVFAPTTQLRAAPAHAGSSLPSGISSRYVVGGGGGTAGSVTAFARVRDTVYIGGLFSRVAERTGSTIVVPAAGGRHEPVRAEVAGGTVYAARADGHGGWYLGGAFSSVGGVARPGLAHLLADGTLDEAFAPATLGDVRALALDGGTLYVATLHQQAAAVRALDAANGQERPAVFAVPSDATSVALEAAAGRVYAAFGTPGIVAYNGATGARVWSRAPLMGTEGLTGMAALAIAGPNVLVGGEFYDGGNRNLDALTGATGRQAGPRLTLDHPVNSVAAIGGMAYVTGPAIRSVALGTGAVRTVVTLHEATKLLSAGTTLYVAGQKAATPPYPTPHWVYALDTSAKKAALRPVSPALSGVAWGLAWQAGRLLVTGGFAGVGGAVRGGLAAFNVRSGTLLPWRPRLDGYASTLATSARTVYVGGLFGHVNGASRPGLAAVDAGGRGRLLRWRPKLTVADPFALATSRGRVLVGGGGFRWKGANRTAYIVALSARSGARLRFSPPVRSTVTALTVWRKTLLVSSDGVLAVRVDGNGKKVLWHRVTRNSFSTGGVFALATSGSTLYAGGRFEQAAGQPRSNFAAFGLDRHGVLLPLAPHLTVLVNSLVPLPGHVVFGGADLESLGSGQALGAIAPDGTVEPWRVDTPSPLGDVGTGTVRALTTVPGGLLVGGDMTWLGPVGRQAAGGLAWLR